MNSSYHTARDVSFGLTVLQFIMSLFSDRKAMVASHHLANSTDETKPLLGSGKKVSSQSDTTADKVGYVDT